MTRMHSYYKRPVMTDACSHQEASGLCSELLLTGSCKGSWEVICSYQFDSCDPVCGLAQHCRCYSRAMNVEGRLSLGWDEQGEMDTGGAAELWEMVERLADTLWEAVLFWWKGLRIIFWQRHWCRERPSVYGKSNRQNRHFLQEKGNYFFSWEWDSVRILPCHRLSLSLPL